MPYAVELYFDIPSESRLQDIADKLASVTGQSVAMSGSRPHLTLTVCESVEVRAAIDAISSFAESVQQFSLTFGAVGLFSREKPVVFLAPKVTTELLAVHSQFVLEFCTIGRDCWPHYLPANWVPHCTVAEDVAPERIGSILEVDGLRRLPITCAVSEIGLVEFRPLRRWCVVPLASRTYERLPFSPPPWARKRLP